MISDSVRVAIPIEKEHGLSSTVSEHFGEAPHFLVCDLKDGKIEEWETRSNPGRKRTVRMGLEAAKFLVDLEVNAVVVVKMGEGPYWLLSGRSVEMFKITDDSGSRKDAGWYAQNYRSLIRIKR